MTWLTEVVVDSVKMLVNLSGVEILHKV